MKTNPPQRPASHTTTAEMFCDELAARRIIKQYAFDDEHAENLYQLLSLDSERVAERFIVGTNAGRDQNDSVHWIEFVDGSVAARTPSGRWTPAAWDAS